jgi:hypothetical protein
VLADFVGLENARRNAAEQRFERQKPRRDNSIDKLLFIF